MKPSYRDHYFKLVSDQVENVSLPGKGNPGAQEEEVVKSRKPGNLLDIGEQSVGLGVEDSGVNVFEDGTILEDEGTDGKGQHSLNEADNFSASLEEVATNCDDDEEEEEEGEVEEEYTEDGTTTHLIEKEHDGIENESLLLAEKIDEGERGEHREDPLDMEVCHETNYDYFYSDDD